MRKKQSGFTLIELMIVVAIVGILAAIAIPAYQDFQIRSKVSEVLASMGACKTKLTDFYDAANASWANRAGTTVENLDLCLQVASEYVQSMDVLANGIIEAAIQDLGGDADAGDLIQMAPEYGANGGGGVGDPITGWICGGGGTDLEARYRPGSCQG